MNAKFAYEHTQSLYLHHIRANEGYLFDLEPKRRDLECSTDRKSACA